MAGSDEVRPLTFPKSQCSDCWKERWENGYILCRCVLNYVVEMQWLDQQDALKPLRLIAKIHI